MLVYVTVVAFGKMYVEDLLIAGSLDWDRVTNVMLLILIALLTLVLAGFVETWRWFGARRCSRSIRSSLLPGLRIHTR